MVAFAIFASLFAGASLVLAGPVGSPFGAKSNLGNCSLSTTTPPLPSGETAVTAPSGQTLSHVALGVGVQNYTCSAAGTYTSAGAVANLYDISCLVGISQFDQITNVAYSFWNSSKLTTADLNAHFTPSFPIFAQHFFGTSPSGTGISPVFDARATSQKGDANAFILAAKTGNIAAPTGKQDVDWLELANVSGSLAKTVLRLDTKAGQPPSSCTPGSALISVKYAAKYWFYN